MAPRKHNCVFCDRVFPDMSTLEEHMRSHTKEQPYFCEHCDGSYASNASLRRHMLRIHPELATVETIDDKKEEKVKIPCEACPQTFSRRSGLTRHMRNLHAELVSVETIEDKAKTPCEHCPKTFSRRSNMRQHMRNVHAELVSVEPIDDKKEEKGEIPCEACQKTFSRRDNMLKHMRNVHPELVSDKGEYSCEHCPRTFHRRGGFTQHMRNVHSELVTGEPTDDKKEEKVQFSCEHCLQTFHRPGNLRYHIKRFHKDKLSGETIDDKKEEKVQFSCEHCPQTFHRPGNLRYHIKRFHKDKLADKDEFSCQHCPRTFQIPGNLNHHMRNVHPELVTDKGEYCCGHCPKTFYRRYNLKRHMELFHKDKLPVETIDDKKEEKVQTPCEHCPKTFNFRGNLKRHMKRFHKDKLPDKGKYCCEHCPKTFKTPECLRRHMLRIHLEFVTDKGDYSCEHCQKTFSRRGGFTQHMLRIHPELVTDKGQYSCKHCLKTFDRRGGFRIHMKRFHKDKLAVYRKRPRGGNLGIGSCLYCGNRFFKKRSRLLIHQNTCPRKNDFKCHYCDEVFVKKNLYLEHLRSFCAKRAIKYKCMLCNSWEGPDPLNILEHAMMCKPTGKLKVYPCNLCHHKFARKTVAYHIQYELLHSRLFKDIPCDFKCESCKVSFPSQELHRLHQELEHPCLLHMVGLEDLDGFTIDPDKREALMDERKRVRDLDPKELECKGLKPKNRCHVCLYPFHCRNVRYFHVFTCEHKFGVKKLEQQTRQGGRDAFPKRKEKPLHVESEPTASMSQNLLGRFLFDMKRNKNIVSRPRYCEKIERELRIARGLLRKWIPFVLKDEKKALDFFNKNLYNEDISVIRVVPKPVPELIDLSEEATTPEPQVPPPAKIFKCQGCHKICASEDELTFHKDTATKYFKKKHNGMIRKNKPKKGRVVIPDEETDYDNLALWEVNGMRPQLSCDGCGHPFFCRNVMYFHKFTCKGKPKEVPKEDSQQQQEKRFLLKELRVVLVRCDDFKRRLKSQEQQQEGEERPSKKPRLGNVEEIKEPTLGLVRWE